MASLGLICSQVTWAKSGQKGGLLNLGPFCYFSIHILAWLCRPETSTLFYGWENNVFLFISFLIKTI